MSLTKVVHTPQAAGSTTFAVGWRNELGQTSSTWSGNGFSSSCADDPSNMSDTTYLETTTQFVSGTTTIAIPLTLTSSRPSNPRLQYAVNFECHLGLSGRVDDSFSFVAAGLRLNNGTPLATGNPINGAMNTNQQTYYYNEWFEVSQAGLDQTDWSAGIEAMLQFTRSNSMGADTLVLRVYAVRITVYWIDGSVDVRHWKPILTSLLGQSLTNQSATFDLSASHGTENVNDDILIHMVSARRFSGSWPTLTMTATSGNELNYQEVLVYQNFDDTYRVWLYYTKHAGGSFFHSSIARFTFGAAGSIDAAYRVSKWRNCYLSLPIQNAKTYVSTDGSDFTHSDGQMRIAKPANAMILGFSAAISMGESPVCDSPALPARYMGSGIGQYWAAGFIEGADSQVNFSQNLTFQTYGIIFVISGEAPPASWATKPIKAYVSGAWTTKPTKVYVGGSWTAKPTKKS